MTRNITQPIHSRLASTVSARSWRKHGPLCATALLGSMSLGFVPMAHAEPAGAVISAGSATVSTAAGTTTINQSSANVAINWSSFSIAANETVAFVQPGANSVALNRVTGSDPSAILGHLTANGQVFLVNPNGILFGKGAQVNVGGLVASTLNIADAEFMAGRYSFSGSSRNSVLNEGAIKADGGYVALLGANVGNNGLISARLGTVALAAGDAITLDVAGNGLLNVTVDKGALEALASNGGLIAADGGHVLLTAMSAGALLHSAVNNTGVIQARSLVDHGGVISLLGDMMTGLVTVGGTLDASAPNGGDGGSIEASAARVDISDSALVTTAATTGKTGSFVIDPADFIIAPTGGDITGAKLSALLVTNSVTISTATGTTATVAGTPPVTTFPSSTPGNGDITVNDAVSWVATPSTTTLKLLADRDVKVNFAVTATNGNFVVCCGRDITVSSAITTTNGSVLLNAGRNLSLTNTGAITTTDGNITLCAGIDITIAGAIVLTRGAGVPSQSLNLAPGIVLIAGNAGTGPSVAGGTVTFAPGTPRVAVTGPNAPVAIYYNPVSYTAPGDYLPNFTLTSGATLTQFMMVYPGTT